MFLPRIYLDDRVLTVLITVFMIIGTGRTLAEIEFDDPTSALNRLNHQTEAQRNVAAATQASWNQVTNLDFSDRQLNFIFRVNELVEVSTGNPNATLEGRPVTDILQQFAHEEVATQGTGVTETAEGQFANIAGRIQALRGGATGFSTTGLVFQGSDGSPLLTSSANYTGGSAGDDTFSRLGGFVSGILTTGDTETTSREDGFDFDSAGITLGFDYRFSDRLVAGAAVGYASAEADIANDDGSLETDGVSLTLYSLFYRESFYLDGSLVFGWNDYDSERHFNYRTDLGADRLVAKGETEGDQIAMSLGGGYEQNLGRWLLDYSARLHYIDAEVDGYSEEGAEGLPLRFEAQDIESLTSELGLRISVTSSRSFGVIIPYGRLFWHHEFKDDSRDVGAVFVHDPFATPFAVPTDDPDRNFFSLGLGISAVFARGLQAFIDYDTRLGLDRVDYHAITAGARWEF